MTQTHDQTPDQTHDRTGEGAARPDLTAATGLVAEVVRGISDEELDGPTPCTESSVATLLDHLAGLVVAFTAVARHEPVPGGDRPPEPDRANLDPAFRESLPSALAALAEAWRSPGAWTGTALVGGVELPREVAGLVALDEVVVHGWDLAVATGQPYSPPAAAVQGALDFVRPAVAESPGGTPGLFGPAVEVPHDASVLERLLALTGRDPGWRP